MVVHRGGLAWWFCVVVQRGGVTRILAFIAWWWILYNDVVFSVVVYILWRCGRHGTAMAYRLSGTSKGPKSLRYQLNN